MSICRDCGEEFQPYKDKPGYVDQCGSCGKSSERRVPKIGGNMIFMHKTGPYIEIKPMNEAKKFAAKSRRLGAGVTASITQSKGRAECEMFADGQWLKTESLKGD